MVINPENVAAVAAICIELHPSAHWQRVKKEMEKTPTSNHEKLLYYVNCLHDGLTYGNWPQDRKGL